MTRTAPAASQRARHAADCTRCGKCVRACAFLTRHGPPADLARGPGATAFGCSLCGLCAAVCPQGLDPGALCLELRREEAAAGRLETRRYRRLLAFEALGRSRWLRGWRLPEGGDAVFFPGCALGGLKPGLVDAVWRGLASLEPRLGLVLDCCGKPSHDLGLESSFHHHFERLLDEFQRRGVRRALTACPNCVRVFREHGRGLRVETVYEVLARGMASGAWRPPALLAEGDAWTLHDPCASRFDLATQAAARQLARAVLAAGGPGGEGARLEEGGPNGERTFCCGEGGAVCFTDQPLCETWLRRRVESLGRGEVLTYCAGCVARLDRLRPARHLLELLFPTARGRRARLGRPGGLRSLARRWGLRRRLGHGDQEGRGAGS